MKRLKAIAATMTMAAMLAGPALAQRHDDRKDDRGKDQKQQQQQRQQQQRQHLGDWIKEHRNQPPQEQRKALQSDPTFKKLPPEKQQELEKRLDKFNSLPPARQDHVLDTMKRWNEFTPEQRSRARGLFTQYRLLPLDRKQAMRQAFSKLHMMSPPQREQAIDSPEFKNQFNDNERDLLRGMTQMHIGPAHEGDEDTGTSPPPLEP